MVKLVVILAILLFGTVILEVLPPTPATANAWWVRLLRYLAFFAWASGIWWAIDRLYH